MRVVLFDIDGTIADIEHRRCFLKIEEPDWKSFNAAMGDDTPNAPVVDLYKTLYESGKYEMILISGRGEESRKLTEQWLSWNDIPFTDLLMRPAKDSRADNIIKKEILDKLLFQGKEILFVVDDRQQVVDMWRENGIVCLQCDVGDF